MDWNLEGAPAALMDAAVDPERWRAALSDLAGASSSLGAVLFATDGRLLRPPCTPGLDRAVDDYAAGGWNVADVRFEAAPLLGRGGVVSEPDFLAPERIATNPFYQDFLLPHGLRWFAGVGFLVRGEPWCLSFQRSAAQGPFQPDELARLRALLRPLGDAATLARLFDDQRLATTLDAVELVGHAALVCDRRGQILKMNGAAERLVGPLYDASSRTLGFGSPASTDCWARMLRRALALSEPGCRSAVLDAPVLDTLVLDAHGDPLVMRAVALSGASRLLFSDGAVLVLVKPRRARLEDALAHRFRLTRGQVGIAEALLAGVSLDEIARARGIKVASVRAQLKEIFARTGTRNQVHLLAVLHAIVAS